MRTTGPGAPTPFLCGSSDGMVPRRIADDDRPRSVTTAMAWRTSWLERSYSRFRQGLRALASQGFARPPQVFSGQRRLEASMRNSKPGSFAPLLWSHP